MAKKLEEDKQKMRRNEFYTEIKTLLLSNHVSNLDLFFIFHLNLFVKWFSKTLKLKMNKITTSRFFEFWFEYLGISKFIFQNLPERSRFEFRLPSRLSFSALSVTSFSSMATLPFFLMVIIPQLPSQPSSMPIPIIFMKREKKLIRFWLTFYL